MRKLETQPPATEAVAFILTRIQEQALQDAVSLSEPELKQLWFSEETASAEQLAATAEFDVGHDMAKFEAKIAKLLRRAFHRDVHHGMEAVWRQNLAALRKQDMYVLVMVDQAKIPRPRANGLTALLESLVPSRLGLTLRRASLVLVVSSGSAYFFLLPMKWGLNEPRIFGNLAEELIPSESVRGAFFLIWIVSVFLLVRKEKIR